LYLAWERVQAPNGTTNMDFELNQSSVLSGNGVTPVRTAGDVLIKYDLARGGSVPTLGFHRWVTGPSPAGQTPAAACEASNAFPCWTKGTPILQGAQAAINSGSVVDPILAPGQTASRTLDALTFGEAGIDLQAANIFTANQCTTFGKAYLKSRSSDSFTSEIKDFIAPIPISVSNCAPKTLPNTASVSASNFAPAGGNLGDPISDSGLITVGQSVTLSTTPIGGRLAQADAGVEVTVGIAAVTIDAMLENVRDVRLVGDIADVVAERAGRGEPGLEAGRRVPASWDGTVATGAMSQHRGSRLRPAARRSPPSRSGPDAHFITVT
jgi:hypothetical protein